MDEGGFEPPTEILKDFAAEPAKLILVLTEALTPTSFLFHTRQSEPAGLSRPSISTLLSRVAPTHSRIFLHLVRPSPISKHLNPLIYQRTIHESNTIRFGRPPELARRRDPGDTLVWRPASQLPHSTRPPVPILS
ncbi:hypothetical protein OPQ81_011273 [Rhizoctonia solani]|nr:hypothetical protein OPQ81_011273 [Rhizoctonia solani]